MWASFHRRTAPAITLAGLTLPAAVLIGAIYLVGGQLLLERLFAFNAAPSIVIEFFGGLTFLALLMRRMAR